MYKEVDLIETLCLYGTNGFSKLKNIADKIMDPFDKGKIIKHEF